YGTLENGLKYVIRHNANPPGRVAMYLHIRTGALNESDAQNGLAHFLEHMAFNGSTHFPPGKLLPLLGGLGMTFGADTNAHTNFWETLYKLNLPNTQPKTIELAAKIFSDYAGGLSLSDTEIDSERKIILEEYRTRQGVGQRIWKQQARDVFAGTKLAKHDIIGDAEQIKSFPPARFRDYYDAWYRPENMTLIVVGDVKPDDILPVAKQWLGALKARSPATQPQKAGIKVSTEPRAFVYTDGEQVNGSLDLTHIGPAEPLITTVDLYRRSLLRSVASGIVNRRLGNLIAAGKAPFRAAATDIDTFFNEGTASSGEASGEPQDWKPMLTTLITEIDRAVQHGVSDAEVQLIVRGILANAQQAVVAEKSRDSVAVIDSIASDIGQDKPLMSAAQELELLKKLTTGLKAAEVSAAFDDAFGTKNYDYVLSMPLGKPEAPTPTPAEVLAAADAAWSAKTEAPSASDAGGDLLAAAPAAGTIASEETDKDLAVATTTFANGVVMHHKYSDYKKDEILVTINLPGGQLEETAENHGVSDLAGAILDRPATSRLTSTQIKDLLIAKNLTLAGDIGRDLMTIGIKATNKDLPTALQLGYALLTDGKLEQSAVDDWKKQQLQAIAKQARDPRAQLELARDLTLLGGDPRFMPLTPSNVQRLTRDQAEAWFKRIAGSAAIEVTVVGDIKQEEATKLVATYLGSLPKRGANFEALDSLRTLKRASGPFEANVVFDSVTPKALAFAGFIGSDENSLDRRPLSVAAEVMTNRMIDRIREKEQLVYSINASSRPSRGLKGTGVFAAGSMTDPTNGTKLADVVMEMFNDFAKTGPTDEELATAKKQIMTEVTTSMREPDWWMVQLSELTYRKRPIADLKSLPGVFDTFTKEDVQGVFAKYLRPETTLRFVVTPKSSATTKPATTRPS
ncbi:MAG: peptidase, partial [Phycisphaerales bacterium]|nr:peptidase [Phycisphaerales bacterium]